MSAFQRPLGFGGIPASHDPHAASAVVNNAEHHEPDVLGGIRNDPDHGGDSMGAAEVHDFGEVGDTIQLHRFHDGEIRQQRKTRTELGKRCPHGFEVHFHAVDRQVAEISDVDQVSRGIDLNITRRLRLCRFHSHARRRAWRRYGKTDFGITSHHFELTVISPLGPSAFWRSVRGNCRSVVSILVL
jgi:hypothetical protein